MRYQAIYFDFDRTLIDTDGLKAEQAQRISRISGISEEQVHAAMKQYIASLEDHLDFHPEEYANFLEDLYSIPAGDVMKIYLGETSYFSAFVFPEVFDVLEELLKRGIILGIFSSAKFEYQLHKLRSTGVSEYFSSSHMIIHPRKLSPEIVARVPSGALVIDDDLAVVEELSRSHLHVTPVWCNRKSSEEHPVHKTIHSLLPLLSLEK